MIKCTKGLERSTIKNDRYFGVIGWPVERSLSPAMHNAAFAHLGLPWVYELLPVEPGFQKLQSTLASLHLREFYGANITVPHKENAFNCIADLSLRARQMGAVNTIKVSPEGHIWGDNTDAEGFITDLREHSVEPARLKHVAILGAGGATRAVAYGLLEAGCRQLTILNRTADRATNLATYLKGLFPGAQVQAGDLNVQNCREIMECELVINCTSLGLDTRAKAMTFLVELAFKPNQIVYDIVYQSHRTPLLEHALECGARAISGLGMFIYQGAASFRLWTGQEAPIEVMKNAILSHS